MRAFFERTLGINAAGVAVLLAIFLTGVGEQLWEPLFPQYLMDKYFQALIPALFAIGIYSAVKNFLEGIWYLSGGRLSQRLGARASLILFGMGPIVGYVLFLAGNSPIFAIAGTVMILTWEPLTVPATFAILGEKKKSMAFVLASIQKRLPKIVGPLAGTLAVGAFGVVKGLEGAVAVALGAAVLALVVQAWLVTPGKPRAPVGGVFAVLREMNPRLHKFLAAEALTRWGDWLVRDFVVIYFTTALLHEPGQFGYFVSVQMATSLLIYLPAGAIADRGNRRLLITLTYFFFAAFPLALGFASSGPLLFAAFVVYGLREIGEPTRKAVVTALMPEGRKSEGVGVYWGLRAFAISPAPIAGALIWTYWGPQTLMWFATGFGALGLLVFAWASRGLDAEVSHQG